MAVGTDFLTFATGSGTNIEDQPSYLADPLRQTGNLPGIARSNFNNKALRQGTFVACAISTFVTQTLDIFVPDDGDVQKYVDYFKQAISAMFVGLLPDDPDLSLYVRKSGDTMSGDLQFNQGSSIQLAYNTWLRGKNAAGTPLNMLMLGSGPSIYISDGSTAYTIFGNTPAVGNTRFWGCQISSGAVQSVLGILADNNTYLNAYNSIYINSSNAWFNSNIIIPNGSWYHSKLTSGAAINLLCCDTANRTVLNSNQDMHLSVASGKWIYMNASNTQFAGNVTAPYLRSVGSGQIDGNFTILGALQVNGGSNFSAHLNVNYGAGATISGTLDTNTLHCISAHAYVDGNLYCWDGYHGGSIFVGGLQAFNSGGWFYFVNALQADQLHSRHDMWCVGTASASYITSSGNVNAAANLTGGGCYAGYIRSYGSLVADSNIQCAGLWLSNSDGFWHTPNGIAVDNLSWLRGGQRFEGAFEHRNGDMIWWNYTIYVSDGGCVNPLYHAQGAVGVGERAWLWITGIYVNAVSDARDKRDIEPVPTGCLDVVRSIVPQAFRIATQEPPTQLNVYDPGPSNDPNNPGRMVLSDNVALNRELETARASQATEAEMMRDSRHWGFLAQDVGRAMQEAGLEFGGRMVSPGGRESLCIMDMVAVLWAAVRELSDEVKSLKAA